MDIRFIAPVVCSLAALQSVAVADTDLLVASKDAPPGALQRQTDDFERERIQQTIDDCGGVKTRAAEKLGITYRGLLKKMRRLGM